MSRFFALLVLFCATFVVTPLTASAITIPQSSILIDNLPATGSIGQLGEFIPFLDGVSSYYAQSFVAPTGGEVTAGALTFSLASNSAGPMDFRVLLTETTGGTELTTPTAIRPTQVLFEDGTSTLAANSPFTTFTVDLYNTVLQGGTTYMWILDAFADRDGVSGLAIAGTRNGFEDGHFLNLNVLGGDRVQHFASNWDDHLTGPPPTPSTDLAFSMSFNVVPEPSSIVLAALGLIGLVVWALAAKAVRGEMLPRIKPTKLIHLMLGMTIVLLILQAIMLGIVLKSKSEPPEPIKLRTIVNY